MAAELFQRWSGGRLLACAFRLASVAAGLMAVLAVALSTPEHVLEPINPAPAGQVASIETSSAPASPWDHHGVGHVCADHCAAHVLGGWPNRDTGVGPAYPDRTAWSVVPALNAPSLEAKALERPPRA